MTKDLFSIQAADYARYRPSYPAELIAYVISFVQEKKLAWDCATGNGQAAVLLAPYFKQVIGTDTSEKQLALAIAAENINYQPAKAEQTPFADNSFDLITVAQAYHWFQFNDFEKEAKRVAKPGGIIAIWGYNIPACDNETINGITRQFYTIIVGPYWDAERKYIDESYKTVPFNFAELPSNEFSIHVRWNKEDLTGYLNSWSSVQHFIKAKGYNPVNEMATQLTAAWPPGKNEIEFIFPVFLRIGKII
ncbi:MAG: class I SAM-dependent methyltransferase [Bacteroidota bacterium]